MISPIETNGLTKRYGRKNMLNNITLTFDDRKNIGLIERNGAGKTTFMPGSSFRFENKRKRSKGCGVVEENTGIPYAINAHTKIKQQDINYHGYYSYQTGVWYLSRWRPK